jgi:hypothetical protein
MKILIGIIFVSVVLVWFGTISPSVGHHKVMRTDHKVLMEDHEKMMLRLNELKGSNDEINRKLDIILNIATNRTTDFR